MLKTQVRASTKSVGSVEKAIGSLKTVNDKITDVWKINEANEHHVANITNSISSLAAVSEEISSSMIEIEARSSEIENACKTLSEDSAKLNEIGHNSADALAPLTTIESGVDNLLAKMGKMTVDPFYSLKNEELSSYLDRAINAHRSWVSKLDTIINTRSIVAFQIDGTKCHFGHFYNSIEPPINHLKNIWHTIGTEHKELHSLGGKIISCMFDERYAEAETMFSEVHKKSEDLIGLMENLKSMLPDRTCEIK